MYRPLHDDDDGVVHGDKERNDDFDADLDKDRITQHDVEMLDLSTMDIDTVNDKSLAQHSNIDQDTTQRRSAEDLFGLDENSSMLSKLIILNRQSSPVIVSYFLSLGGNFINLLFAGRFINSNDRNQVFAGMEMNCMIVLLDCSIATCKHEPHPPSCRVMSYRFIVHVIVYYYMLYYAML